MSQSGPSSFRKFFSKKVDEDKVEEEILSMVEEGHEHGLIEEGEMELINNIFEFGDKEAKDIMTPRQKIVAVENTQTVEQALQLAVENNFSRYPVYEEDLDNIIGLIHIKDLIAVYMKDPKSPIADIVDKAIVTHPTKDVSELLQRMQREKIHMAVVVDEYGQTEGIVTMEDILEEIVGNILDEHDEEQPEEIQKKSEDEYLVDGGATLEDLEDLLGIEFPDEDFETVNGFLLYELGRLPEAGEKFNIEYQGYAFTPEKIEDNRIITVRIKKLQNNLQEEE
jgi:putative hemolysin